MQNLHVTLNQGSVVSICASKHCVVDADMIYCTCLAELIMSGEDLDCILYSTNNCDL